MKNNFETVIKELIERAENREFSEFTLLRTYHEYRLAKKYARNVKKTAKLFLDLSKKFESKLDTCVSDGIVRLDQIRAFSTSSHVTLQTYLFYSEELKTILSMIQEFKVYLKQGNFIFCLLGGLRKYEYLYDFRDTETDCN